MARDDDMERPLKVSDLERISGVRRSSIHSYIKKGLLSAPLRTGKTMAYYSDVHLEELEEISRLKDKGYPLSFIQQMMNEKRKKIGSSQARDKSPEKTKDNILKKAVHLFAEKGYYKTRMSDIAELADMSRSTLYLFVESKQALFLECVDEVLAEMITDISSSIEEEGDPVMNLVKTSEVVLRLYPHFLEILLVVDNMFGEDPGLKDKGREIYNSASAIVVNELNDAVEKGLFPEMDTMLFSFMIMGLAKGFESTRQLFDHYTVEDFFDIAEKIISFFNMSMSSK